MNIDVDVSVIMPVHNKVETDQFLSALESIRAQTKPASELIVVIDGPVELELQNTINKVVDERLVNSVQLPKNVGAGHARHNGICLAKHDVIMLMDSDDISDERRIEKQLVAILNGSADVVGGYIEEFNQSIGDLKRVRKVPLRDFDIRRVGKWRFPVNHVTLMFSKQTYLNSGGYANIPFVEDYDFFHRLVTSGATFLNIDDVLVHVRTGPDQIKRRRGLGYLKYEIALFWRMKKSQYITVWHFVTSILIRFVIRSLPIQPLNIVYAVLRKLA